MLLQVHRNLKSVPLAPSYLLGEADIKYRN